MKNTEEQINIHFSLVIPCYNESGNIELLVKHCRQLLELRKDIEVVLVDNGSFDDTASMLGLLLENNIEGRLRSVRVEKNKGYGYGIIFGLKNCKGKILGWTHADMQADPVDFVRAIEYFEFPPNDGGNVFVKGERYGRSLRDRLFTWAMSFVERIILGVRMTEINAQPTVFSNSFFQKWHLPPNDFSLDLYVYQLALRNNLKVKRFPVYFGPRFTGEGHNDALISKFRYSWKTILFSLQLRSRLMKSEND